ncbi:hypothetical protein QDA05_gp27 [Microbacterium phage Honeyfin]|uniref:Uncharacterized protein n=9 Tax=Caudoviricetes TaxID=2731619 RepID=A0A8F3EDS7_9CAUD|nr:hypothetical protein QDA05_gp27 [Microbacterium phage Honeyfin]YP_010751497.1 hypothetical protein QDA06_gp25 [Microbacterium phage Shotgun]QDF19040.1 hypothetical protein SEA_BUSEPHILIS_25 [Microbacterium phage Busephilis]QGH76564.1 hypothetical protein SEA_ANTARES_26 [Microbacterium phage Antares]QOC58050.1 hypothetical protein SEA_SCUMBERLAND_27 [Microbacterium phage Scumberland]QTF81543.1 hypothetical protein SEA_PULCHRA_27 [Microbacterium phage Pulchra]QWY84807.1 hypothetical protein 
MIMGCACNKQKSNGLAAKREESATTSTSAKSDTESRQATTASRLSAPTSRRQSFALESGGRTASFGSRLERDAAAARSRG